MTLGRLESENARMRNELELERVAHRADTVETTRGASKGMCELRSTPGRAARVAGRDTALAKPVHDRATLGTGIGEKVN